MAYRFTLYERERLELTRHYILDNLHMQLKLPELCVLCTMNRNKLNEGFKKYYGKNIVACIKEYRMQKAKKLLIETDDAIRDIAEATGYAYPTNFLKAYKNYFGYTAGFERRKADRCTPL
jgi:AraC family transcriptional regulator, transcriptional activator of the genes for pyochelin and ferripyochelin receptors